MSKHSRKTGEKTKYNIYYSIISITVTVKRSQYIPLTHSFKTMKIHSVKWNMKEKMAKSFAAQLIQETVFLDSTNAI